MKPSIPVLVVICIAVAGATAYVWGHREVDPWAESEELHPITLQRSDGHVYKSKRSAEDCCSLGALVVAQQEQSLLDAGVDADAAGLLDAIKGRAAERLTACMGGPAVRCAR